MQKGNSIRAERPVIREVCMKRKLLLLLGMIALFLFGGSTARAAEAPLSARESSIAVISALAAKGDMDGLRGALAEGLDRGLTVNEEKELMVQLYAYAGFPRGLNGMTAVMNVVNERKAAGLSDEIGAEPEALPAGTDREAYGERVQTELTGRRVGGGMYDFTPVLNTFLREHLFCDVFSRGLFTWRERELATVSMLAGIGNVNAQLRSHMGVAMHNGVTAEELRALTALLAKHVDEKTGANAEAVLAEVLS